MTDTERQRLAAILGMLGSDAAGERDNAARLAEQFRKQHGLTWQDMINGKTLYVSREIPVERTVYVDRPVYLDREVVVEKVVYLSFWDWLISHRYLDRGIGIVLGAIPLALILFAAMHS